MATPRRWGPNKRSSLAQDKEIGKRIKVRRLELNMSQQSLGEALELTFQQIQKYEKGTNRVSAGRLQQIAKILKVSPSFFYDSGTQTENAAHGLFELLDTAYSMRLVKAFAKIEDRRVRRSAVELVEEIADQVASPRRRD